MSFRVAAALLHISVWGLTILSGFSLLLARLVSWPFRLSAHGFGALAERLAEGAR